jgi:pimeloyl-ACP methyl ester carboxylesterase
MRASHLGSCLALSLWAACTAKPALAPSANPQSPAAQRGHDAELSTYAYPYEVRFRDFDAQGQHLRMAYMDVQPSAPNGHTVLLLHGKNFSGAYWADTIAPLVARGFRVLAPDQVGFGKSSKPTHFQYSFHALASYTRDLLDALGIARAHVVGHSMGGMLATRFALQFAPRVERLVLVNPIGLEDWSRVVPYTPIEQAYARELQNDRDKIREYMRQSYFAGQWQPAYEPLLEPTAGFTEGPDRERVAYSSALTADMIFTQPVVHDFARISQPTLLIIGTRDRTALGKHLVSPELAQTLGDYERLGKAAAQAIPRARLAELPGVGHLPQVEAFAAYLEHLSSFLEVR